MGYPYAVYTVDLKQLATVCGKKNAALGKELRKKFADEIADNYEALEDQIVEQGAPVLARALYEIFAGKPSAPKYGFQYGYALELLCKHLGKRVDDEELTFIDHVLDPLLKQARCPDTEQMLGRGVLPLKLPRPASFLEIGTVEPAGCIAALGALATIRPMTTYDDERMVIDEVRGWFAAAKKAKRGVVWFQSTL